MKVFSITSTYIKKIIIITITALLLLNINSIAQCSVSAGNDTTICQGANLVRTISNIPTGAQISWYLQGNSTAILSTSATLNTTPYAPGVFYYIVKLDNTGGGTNCPA